MHAGLCPRHFWHKKVNDGKKKLQRIEATDDQLDFPGALAQFGGRKPRNARLLFMIVSGEHLYKGLLCRLDERIAI